MANISGEILAALLNNVNMDKLTDEQRKSIEQTKKDATATLEKARLKKQRDTAAEKIAGNVKPVLDNLSGLDIPIAIDIITLKYSYNTATGQLQEIPADFMSVVYGFKQASRELMFVAEAINNPETISTVIDLDEILIDDFIDFFVSTLGYYNIPSEVKENADPQKIKTDARVLGRQRLDSILSQSAWDSSASNAVHTHAVQCSEFMNGVDIPDEKVSLTIYYNSSKIQAARHGEEKPSCWYADVKIGKTVGTGSGQRKSTSRVRGVDGYKTLRAYCEAEFVGTDSPHYDKELTELVKKWGFNSGKWNISKELVRIESGNSSGPQLYTAAKKKADEAFKGGYADKQAQDARITAAITAPTGIKPVTK